MWNQASEGAVELLVRWLGFQWDDRTLQPLDQMKEDIPGVVEHYLYTVANRNLKHTVLSPHFN